MPLKYPAKGGKEFAKVSPGLHVAVCYMVVDVGLQPGHGKYPDPKRQLRLQFEVPGETIEYEKDGKTVTGPMTIGTFYTASMSSKALLRKALEGWRNKKFSDAEAEEFDIATILGKPCQIQVMHSDDGQYANITAILPAPKGCKEKATNKLVFFANDGTNDGIDNVPEWLQQKITAQLDPAVANPPPPLNQPSVRPTIPNSRTSQSSSNADEQEASRAAARAAQEQPEFDDEIPF